MSPTVQVLLLVLSVTPTALVTVLIFVLSGLRAEIASLRVELKESLDAQEDLKGRVHTLEIEHKNHVCIQRGA